MEGNDQTISYKMGGSYTMKTSFDYVPGIEMPNRLNSSGFGFQLMDNSMVFILYWINVND